MTITSSTSDHPAGSPRRRCIGVSLPLGVLRRRRLRFGARGRRRRSGAFSLRKLFSPMPLTFISSSTFLKPPFFLRYSTMRVAVAGPMPGSASSCASVAAFRLSGAGRSLVRARRRLLRGQGVRRQQRNGRGGGDESGGERREHVRSPGKPRGPSGGERCPAHGDVRGRVMGVSRASGSHPLKASRGPTARASRRRAQVVRAVGLTSDVT